MALKHRSSLVTPITRPHVPYSIFIFRMTDLQLLQYRYVSNIIMPKLNQETDLQNIIGSKKNINNVLTNSDIDCVFICTPTKTHYELVKKCIEHNIKIIFCEKPFTGCYYKAKELIELAKKRGISIFVDNIFLYRKEFMNITNDGCKEIKFIWKKNETKQERQAVRH